MANIIQFPTNSTSLRNTGFSTLFAKRSTWNHHQYRDWFIRRQISRRSSCSRHISYQRSISASHGFVEPLLAILVRRILGGTPFTTLNRWSVVFVPLENNCRFQTPENATNSNNHYLPSSFHCLQYRNYRRVSNQDPRASRRRFQHHCSIWYLDWDCHHGCHLLVGGTTVRQQLNRCAARWISSCLLGMPGVHAPSLFYRHVRTPKDG